MNKICTTLLESLQPHFDMSKSRLMTLCFVMVGLTHCRSVNLSHIAATIGGDALLRSNYRRLQRFFQYVRLEADNVAPLVVKLLNLYRPTCLVLDRTNWQIGKQHVNILMLAIVTRRFRLPIIWTILSHSGNSNTSQRIDLLKRYLALFGVQSIEILLADRAFIRAQWIDFLNENNIPFAIRLRSEQHIHTPSGQLVCLNSWARGRRARRNWIQINGQLKAGKADLTFLAKQLKSDEWLIIATNMKNTPKKAARRYQKRWGIECLFGDTKTRGFNLEETRLKGHAKITTYLVIITLSMGWAYRCATTVRGMKAIKRKSHGQREKSFFRIGFDALRNWLIHKQEKAVNAWSKMCPKRKIKQCVVYCVDLAIFDWFEDILFGRKSRMRFLLSISIFSLIVGTNGAGAAFAAGFLCALSWFRGS